MTRYKHLKARKIFNYYLSLNLSVLVSRRLYSTNSDNNSGIEPVVVSYNCGLERARILRTSFGGKAAVYRLVNNINNKTYIGSTAANFSTFSKFYKANFDNNAKTGRDINSTLGVNPGVKPVVTYPDAELYKHNILKDNKNKAGIYR